MIAWTVSLSALHFKKKNRYKRDKCNILALPIAQTVKNLPARQETQVRSLHHENPLEKGMATHPVFLPGESHGLRSLVGYSPWGRKELDTTERLHFHWQISTLDFGFWGGCKFFSTFSITFLAGTVFPRKIPPLGQLCLQPSTVASRTNW